MVWDDMVEDGIAIKKEEHQQRVPRSQRGGEIIEPLVSSQVRLDEDRSSKL
jgi:valyl-tRNA synthetase